MEPIFIHNHLLSRNFTLEDLYLTSRSVRNDAGPTATATNTSNLAPGSALGRKRRKKSAESSLNQPKATRVCIRSIKQSNRSIAVHLLFLFSPRVFISRSYENRSKQNNKSAHVTRQHVIFSTFLWSPLLNYVMKFPNAPSFGEREHKGKNFSRSFWTRMWPLRIYYSKISLKLTNWASLINQDEV